MALSSGSNGESHDNELYHLLFEKANTGIMLLNLQGQFVVVNQRVCSMLGFSREELLGRRFEDLVLSRDYDKSLQDMHLLFERKTDQFLTVQCLVCKDGSYLWTGLKGTIIATKSDIDYCLIVLHEDVTRGQEIQSVQRLDVVLAAAMRDSAATLTSTLDIDEVLDRILSQVARVVPYDTASFMQVDENGTAYIVRHRGWVERGAPESVLNVRFCVKDTHSLWTMFSEGHPFGIPDTRLYDGWRTDIPEIKWVRSYIGVPVRTADDFLGFLNLDSARPGSFDDEQAERLQAFADQAAIAITNARLYAEVRRNAIELEQRVTERTAELHRAKEHVEVILESSSDGIVLSTVEGTILQANRAFNQILGYGTAEIIGKNLISLMDPEHVEIFKKSLAEVASSSQSMRVEVSIHRPDNTRFMADLALAPFALQDPGEAQIICSLRDISKRIQIEDELRKALVKEKELSELKARFATMVSHEFRTPLTTIGLKAWLLRVKWNELSQEKRNETFDVIGEQIKLLTSFMQDILEISRSDALGLQLHPVNIDLDTFCGDMLEEIIQSSELSMADRFVYTTSGTCAAVLLDPNLLRQIVTNLLSNAVKYSPSNSNIYLDVSCSDVETRITVKDKGIGIPPNEVKNLFSPFYRATNVEQISGTGLGLAIVERAVNAYGGTVTVDSELGQGSTFVVTIPVVVPETVVLPRKRG